jgi:hypothetical protein
VSAQDIPADVARRVMDARLAWLHTSPALAEPTADRPRRHAETQRALAAAYREAMAYLDAGAPTWWAMYDAAVLLVAGADEHQGGAR